MSGGSPLPQLDPQDLQKCQDDIAALALREFMKQKAGASAGGLQPSAPAASQGSVPPGWSMHGMAGSGMGFGPGGLGGPAGGSPMEPFQSRQQQEPGLTTEELLKKFDTQRDRERLEPMDAKEWRMRQEKGLKPELANANLPTPSMEELMAQCRPQLRKKLLEVQESDPKSGVPLSPDEEQRQQALKEFEHSQMPAVATEDGDGRLIKTIEHYSFADSEDTASFYIHFDKDLWDGASKHIKESQIKVDSRPTSLQVTLKDVPVSDKTLLVLADWRLILSPLFARVEPLMTVQKVRNGKLSIKVAKVKNQPWKKGVKH